MKTRRIVLTKEQIEASRKRKEPVIEQIMQKLFKEHKLPYLDLHSQQRYEAELREFPDGQQVLWDNLGAERVWLEIEEFKEKLYYLKIAQLEEILSPYALTDEEYKKVVHEDRESSKTQGFLKL